MRLFTMWNFCERIDRTAGFCDWAHTPKNPRGGEWIKETYGRQVKTPYNGVACESAEYGKTSLKMTCLPGEVIDIQMAQYGRWNTQTCASDISKLSCKNGISRIRPSIYHLQIFVLNFKTKSNIFSFSKNKLYLWLIF